MTDRLDDETLAEAQQIIDAHQEGAATDTQLLRFARAIVGLRATIERVRAAVIDVCAMCQGEGGELARAVYFDLTAALGPAGADHQG